MIINMIILILNFYLYIIKDYILYLNQTSGVIIKMLEIFILDFFLQLIEQYQMLSLGWTPPPPR